MQTIGVALAVPEPWASRVQAYRTSLGDAGAARIPTHVTLIPPTEVTAEDLVAIEKHLEAVAAEHRPFVLHLHGTGTFRPVSPVVFVALARGVAECTSLARDVRQGPLAIDLAFPYHPHVTLGHDLTDERLDRAAEEMGDFDVEFEVVDFHLYRHLEGEGWAPTRSFPLGG